MLEEELVLPLLVSLSLSRSHLSLSLSLSLALSLSLSLSLSHTHTLLPHLFNTLPFFLSLSLVYDVRCSLQFWKKKGPQPVRLEALLLGREAKETNYRGKRDLL
jgi:hypothetical protein